MPKRGEIWLANLNPQRGTEPGKTRPVLIVQSQALLDVGHRGFRYHGLRGSEARLFLMLAENLRV